MSKHQVPRIWPPIIEPGRFGRNGMTPSSQGFRKVCEGLNFVAVHCRRQILMKSQPWDSVNAGDAGDFIWPCYFRTSQITTKLRVVAGVVRSDYDYVSLALAPPEFGITVKNSAGSTVVAKAWPLASLTPTTGIVPSDIHRIHDVIEGLSPDTEYYLVNSTLAGSRVVYLSITECDAKDADDSLDSVTSPANFVDGGPIHDVHFEDLITANNHLWRHNGAHLIDWCLPYQEGASGSGPQASSGTYTNVIDAGSTTAPATGFNLFTQYHNTYNRTSIPVKFAAKVRRDSGAGTCDVRLTDGTNSLAITGISGTPATDGWVTGTGTIPPQAGTQWDLQARVSAGSYQIAAFHMWEWES